jgi:hypothetical protein
MKIDELYKKVFGSKEGELVFRDICKKGHILSTSKLDDFQQGQRSIVMGIISILDSNGFSVLRSQIIEEKAEIKNKKDNK